VINYNCLEKLFSVQNNSPYKGKGVFMKRTALDLPVEQFLKMTESKIEFQRSSAWNSALQEAYISDFISGKYIPRIILAERSGKQFVFILDGLQRRTALSMVVNGKAFFKLNGGAEKTKDKLLKCLVPVEVVDFTGCPESEERELFLKLNCNSVKLNAAELRRVSYYDHPIMRVFYSNLQDRFNPSEWVLKFRDIMNKARIKIDKSCKDEDILLTLLAFGTFNPDNNNIKGSKNKFLDFYLDNHFNNGTDDLTYPINYKLDGIVNKIGIFESLIRNQDINEQLVLRSLGIAFEMFSEKQLNHLKKEICDIVKHINSKKYDTNDNRNTSYWNNVLSDVFLELKKLNSERKLKKSDILKKDLSSSGDAQPAATT
jgi:hypothetical protein